MRENLPCPVFDEKRATGKKRSNLVRKLIKGTGWAKSTGKQIPLANLTCHRASRRLYIGSWRSLIVGKPEGVQTGFVQPLLESSFDSLHGVRPLETAPSAPP